MKNLHIDNEQSIILSTNDVDLDGFLSIPKEAHGLVIFVHGSGSSRFSTRNQYVASLLNKSKLATLLFDLFTPEEEVIDSRTRELRFDIEFLANRLVKVTEWCVRNLSQFNANVAYFGASTGGGGALVAATRQPSIVKAVVSRGGRPDLAGESLALVKSPTLFIVGSNDEPIIEVNQTAMSKMSHVTELKIIPGATHLFEEPGTLEQAALLATEWFVRYLCQVRVPST